MSALFKRGWHSCMPIWDVAAYGLVGLVADLLAHQLVHPVVGLVVLAAAVREAGDDERHVGGYCWRLIEFVGLVCFGMCLVQ
jgi:hypothetical protein